MSPTEPEVIVPDLPEPIVAYRAWRWDLHGLHSMHVDTGTAWPADGPVVASCHAERPWFIVRNGLGEKVAEYGHEQAEGHPCPSPPGPDELHGAHPCGIYAYRTVEDAWLHGIETSGAGAGAALVFGQVLLWGRVWEHERGYRAEYAQVATLYRLPDDQQILGGSSVEFLAAGYRVPVEDFPLDDDTRARMVLAQDDFFSVRPGFPMQRSGTLTVPVGHWSNANYVTAPVSGVITFMSDPPGRRPRRWPLRVLLGVGGTAAFWFLGMPWSAVVYAAVYALTHLITDLTTRRKDRQWAR